MAVIMIPVNRGLLDRAVPPLDLPIGPGMLDFGKPMFNPIFFAPHVKHMGHVDRCGTRYISWREGELDTSIRQHSMDFIRYGCDPCYQKGRGRAPVRLGNKRDDGKL